MFASVSIRVDKAQQLLALLMQQNLAASQNMGQLGVERDRLAGSFPFSFPEAALRGSEPLWEVISRTSAPSILKFGVTGVAMSSVVLQSERPTNQVPYTFARLNPGGATLPLVRSL